MAKPWVQIIKMRKETQGRMGKTISVGTGRFGEKEIDCVQPVGSADPFSSEEDFSRVAFHAGRASRTGREIHVWWFSFEFESTHSVCLSLPTR